MLLPSWRLDAEPAVSTAAEYQVQYFWLPAANLTQVPVVGRLAAGGLRCSWWFDSLVLPEPQQLPLMGLGDTPAPARGPCHCGPVQGREEDARGRDSTSTVRTWRQYFSHAPCADFMCVEGAGATGAIVLP